MQLWSKATASLNAGAGLAAALLLAPLSASADPDPLNPTRLPPQVIYNYGENDTTRSAAMGGALRALGSGTTAVLLNPSAMAATRVYHVNATVQFTPETGRQMYGTTVADSVTSKLAGSIAVAGGYMDPHGLKRTVFDIRA